MKDLRLGRWGAKLPRSGSRLNESATALGKRRKRWSGSTKKDNGFCAGSAGPRKKAPGGLILVAGHNRGKGKVRVCLPKLEGKQGYRGKDWDIEQSQHQGLGRAKGRSSLSIPEKEAEHQEQEVISVVGRSGS